MRVLLVEDDLPLASVLADVLRDAGHEVVAANDGRTAESVVSSGKFDVYILDYRLPDQTGAEILRRIEQIAGKAPTVLISRFVSAAEANIEGVGIYLRKPFTYLELLRSIESVAA